MILGDTILNPIKTFMVVIGISLDCILTLVLHNKAAHYLQPARIMQNELRECLLTIINSKLTLFLCIFSIYQGCLSKDTPLQRCLVYDNYRICTIIWPPVQCMINNPKKRANVR